jgi:hypothetical protein
MRDHADVFCVAVAVGLAAAVRRRVHAGRPGLAAAVRAGGASVAAVLVVRTTAGGAGVRTLVILAAIERACITVVAVGLHAAAAGERGSAAGVSA